MARNVTMKGCGILRDCRYLLHDHDVGIGSVNHLTGELHKPLTGTPDIVQVLYRGAGPAIQDLIAGQLPMVIAGANGQLLELHRSGKLLILAVTSQTRPVAAPEIPTVAEEGLPGLTNKGSIGLLAPAGTPKAIIELIARDAHSALAEARISTLPVGSRLRTRSRFYAREISKNP